MPSIRLLPDHVANQIAAGEVIERPAAVVKELVENALDARATRIEVEYRHGGRSYIRVEDNGQGMSKQDALLSLERHATSKIGEASDLGRIMSFGFRGEALPSVASVSRFLLRTRPANATEGTEILVNAGKILKVRECGMPVGTRIEVSQLFNSVPARRKFLKTDTTESAHIIQFTRLFAVAHPEVAFKLEENGRIVFQSPACPSLLDRIREVFGRQPVEALLPIDGRDRDLALSGYVGRPGTSRSSRHEMITFVNRRPVNSRTLSYALLDAYQTVLVKGRYPLAFVFLEIDPSGVDVNVHPAKREVRFRDEGRVRQFVVRNVLRFLERDVSVGPAENESGREAPPVPRVFIPPPNKSFPQRPPSLAPGEQAHPQPSPDSMPSPPARDGAQPSTSAPTVADWSGRLIGFYHDLYALFETEKGLILLDRRAAYERILYEEILADFEKAEKQSQALLIPQPVELDAIQSALLVDHMEFLEASGLGIAPFGRNFFRIERVPAWLREEDAEPFLRDLLAWIRERGLPVNQPMQAREHLAGLAARQAARGLERPEQGETEALMQRLFRCRQPHTSPRGRSTLIELARAELERRFGR